MKTSFETERLLLREVRPGDDRGFYELDSDPEVHRYLVQKPVRSIEECREVFGGVEMAECVGEGVSRKRNERVEIGK